MDPNLNHWIAIVIWGCISIAIMSYVMSCRGDLGRFVIFIIAIICMIAGAAGQILFESMSTTYQVIFDAGKIDAKLYGKLMGDAKFWGQIIGTIYIGLGVGLLVAYLSHKPVNS